MGHTEFANVTVSAEAVRFAVMTFQEHFSKLNEKLNTLYDLGESNAITKLVAEYFYQTQNTSAASIPSSAQIEQINKYTTELLNRRPVQYVLNEAWFYNLQFELNESVLIPRPETEELVHLIIKEIQTRSSTIHYSRFTILDIGTGSGCIPITIKKNIPEAEVSAVDVCSEALHVAVNNAVKHETEINFQLLDFLDQSRWNELGMYDYIISNPPYIKTSESNNMSSHVLKFEPHKALFVPDDDALIFYRKIADFALKHLKPGGSVYVEINQQLGNETADVFNSKKVFKS